MKEQDEQLLKDTPAYFPSSNQANSRLAQSGCCGLGATTQSARSALCERIEGQAQSAEYQGLKAVRLRELSALLDKHPDIARILDLLEEVRQ